MFLEPNYCKKQDEQEEVENGTLYGGTQAQISIITDYHSKPQNVIWRHRGTEAHNMIENETTKNNRLLNKTAICSLPLIFNPYFGQEHVHVQE